MEYIHFSPEKKRMELCNDWKGMRQPETALFDIDTENKHEQTETELNKANLPSCLTQYVECPQDHVLFTKQFRVLVPCSTYPSSQI